MAILERNQVIRRSLSKESTEDSKVVESGEKRAVILYNKTIRNINPLSYMPLKL